METKINQETMDTARKTIEAFKRKKESRAKSHQSTERSISDKVNEALEITLSCSKLRGR